MPKTINRDELNRRIIQDNAPVVLEALPEKYFIEGHLPGAKHMPHDEVKERAAELAPDKDASIVVYCASDACRNSHQAAAELVSLGYTDVAVYPGGKQDWQKAGLELETC